MNAKKPLRPILNDAQIRQLWCAVLTGVHFYFAKLDKVRINVG